MLSALLHSTPGPPSSNIQPLANISSIFLQYPKNKTKSKELFSFPSFEFAGTSNVFGATKERSATGGSLLANDPHFELSAPSLFYLARLQLNSGGVIGASIPGTPIILSGRNEKLAWGISASYLDDQDIFIEELNMENPNLYRTEKGWEKFKIDRQFIKVKDSSAIEIERNCTINGTILPHTAFALLSITPKTHVAALSWTALSDADTTVSAAINLMLSNNVEKGLNAL